MPDKTDVFSFIKTLILGALKSLCPGALSNAKLNKICSLTTLTKLPLMQSLFEWILSIAVIILGFSFLYDPGIF